MCKNQNVFKEMRAVAAQEPGAAGEEEKETTGKETAADMDMEMELVDTLRGEPLDVGTLEEMIDEHNAIVMPAHSAQMYVPVMSFVDSSELVPGCSVLLHHATHHVVGVLKESSDPAVMMMKVDKAPLESFGDIGGLEQQIRDIKEAVEVPLTHPELYEEMGIQPPKGVHSLWRTRNRQDAACQGRG